MPKVTIAIPTYDRPALLKQAIQSVLLQTYQDYEVIVSDDGSNSETVEVARSTGDPRVKYRRTAGKLGVPRHFNECVRIAQGELFALLPDDDLYAPQYLQRMVAALELNPTTGFAQAGFYAVDQDLRCIQEMLSSNSGFTAAGEDALVWQLKTLTCNPVALVYRRSAMLAVGLWREDEGYFDDWAFAVRVAYRHGFIFVPELLACVRRHDGNLSADMQKPGVDHVVRIVNQQADVFREAGAVTDRLLEVRARLSRECSHRSIIAALRCGIAGDWESAHRAIQLARALNPLAGLDPGVIAFGLRNLRARKQESALRLAARSKRPVLAL
ncbi:MAG: glycosyltransferase family 2 protein [Vicinamibacterales bacterium]|jgi:glycosyltransferase involved in cell wall biosynthesis